MKIITKYLPIKAHYFLFMAAAGPVLPFITVLGKQLGIPEFAMGFINAVLPFVYLLSKPLYGYIVDYFLTWRIYIFTISVAIMGIVFFMMFHVSSSQPYCEHLAFCSPNNKSYFEDGVKLCDVSCKNGSDEIYYIKQTEANICLVSKYGLCRILDSKCISSCNSGDAFNFTMKYEGNSLFETSVFWCFIIFMSLGMVLFNTCSSFSDAICFDILGSGNHMKYGQQRVWGSIGYGITAFSTGYLVDTYSTNSVIKNHTPAIVLLAVFILLDVLICLFLKAPESQQSHNILKDAIKVLQKPKVPVFMFFVVMFGICDSFVIYYLFWYLEDISSVTGMDSKIRSIEGLITFLQTFCGEIIFFNFSSKIVAKLGFDKCFTLCFFGHFVRLMLYAFIPSIWWALPIEAIGQGLTYALSYTLIVSYTSNISTPGVQATMQSVTTAIYDGLGYALGSFFGGLFYKSFGGSKTFIVFSLIALFSGILNLLIFKKESTRTDASVTYEEKPQSSDTWLMES